MGLQVVGCGGVGWGGVGWGGAVGWDEVGRRPVELAFEIEARRLSQCLLAPDRDGGLRKQSSSCGTREEVMHGVSAR
jgi:hypothetical protein